MAGGTGPLEEVRVAVPPMPPPEMPQSTGPSSGTSAGDTGSSEAGSAGSFAVRPLAEHATPGYTRSFGISSDCQPSKIPLDDLFFDYDRFAIRNDAKPALEANATALKSEPNVKILIEGHCDERGTSEYNLVL